MKQTFRKISSLLTAIVVFLSTMSFTIDMHYCGDILVDSAIFEKVGTAGAEYMLSRDFSLMGSYDSRFGGGAGLSV